jgi:prepilin-type processing-associated H-X9-DG protein
MNRAFVQRLFPFLVVGALVLSAPGARQTVLGDAFQDRLFGDRFKRIAPEEVSAVVEKHPDDGALLYAASSFLLLRMGNVIRGCYVELTADAISGGFFPADRRRELLDKAVSLDRRYEPVALAQELYLTGVMPGRAEQSTSPRASEILARLMVLDPENALPHWFLADEAFKQDRAEEGFAQIADALGKRRFETYDSAHLRAQFHLLDALGRDGILKYSTMAATLLPHLGIGRQMSQRLVARGKQRLSGGDRDGALDDFAAVDRLADQLLCARPLFAVCEAVAVRIKLDAAQARLELYEAEGDAAAGAGARLQTRALSAYIAQIATAVDVHETLARMVDLVESAGVTVEERVSGEALQAELAKPAPFDGTLDAAGAQFRDLTASPEFERMMNIWFGNLLDEGESAAFQKAGEFYRQSSLPQKKERLKEAFGALEKAGQQLPKNRDWVCTGNLIGLGGAIFIYTDAHSGALPGSLEVLVSGGYVKDQAILKCPVSGTQYVYVGKGLKAGIDPNTIIAYDDSPAHSGSRHALFVDGHVETMPEKAFTERLRQQQHPEQPAPGSTQ